MRILLIASIASLVASSVPAAVNAQIAQPVDGANAARPVWLNAGLAMDATGDFVGIGGSLSLRNTERNVITGRFAHLEEFQLCIFGPCAAEPETRTELGLLYGVARQAGWLYVAGSAGLGYFGGTRTVGEADQESFATLGVPAEIQLYLRPTSFLGFGVTGIANFNAEETLAGIMLGVQLGRFRGR